MGRGGQGLRKNQGGCCPPLPFPVSDPRKRSPLQGSLFRGQAQPNTPRDQCVRSLCIGPASGGQGKLGAAEDCGPTVWKSRKNTFGSSVLGDYYDPGLCLKRSDSSFSLRGRLLFSSSVGLDSPPAPLPQKKNKLHPKERGATVF